jgi:hydrophobe/amphiphile efflux-3 (HAE3) family protein
MVPKGKISVEKVLERLASFQYRHYKKIIIAALIITLFMGYGLAHLQFQGDIDKEMPQDLPVFKLDKKLKSAFIGQEFMAIALCLNDNTDAEDIPRDVRDPRIIGSVVELHKRLEAEPLIVDVLSVAPFFQRGIPDDTAGVKRVLESVPGAEQYLNSDSSIMLLYAFTTAGADEKMVNEVTNAILKDTEAIMTNPAAVEYRITGTDSLVAEMIKQLHKDIVLTTSVAAIIIFLLLVLLKRSLSKGIIIFLPLILTVIWTFGTMGFLGMHISITTIVIGAIILGLGVEYGIFMVSRYYEERESKGPEEAFTIDVSNIGAAIFGSAAVTIVAFLALTISIMPLIQHLGLTLALGIAFCWFVATVINPCFIILNERMGSGKLAEWLPKRAKAQKKRVTLRGQNKELLHKYAKFVTYRRHIVIAILLIFTIFMGYQASLTTLAAVSQKDLLPKGCDVVKTMDLISNQFAGSIDKAVIVVESEPNYAKSDEIRDVRDPEVLLYIDALTKRAKLMYGVVGAGSAADVIKEVNGGKIPSSLESVKLLLEKNEMAEQQMSHYINDDYTMSVVSLDMLANLDEAIVVKDLQEVIKRDKPPGVKVGITGDSIVTETMIKLAGTTMQSTSSLSLVLIILALIIIFASIKYGLIPITTIIFGSIWTYGVLFLAAIEVTAMTSGALAMIMGIGIDFGIQVTKRFRFELQSYEREEAMVNTLTNVFYPMIITTIAAVIAFLCLVLGELPMLVDMGKMLAVGVVCCMVAALTIVPAFLVLLERGKKSLQ